MNTVTANSVIKQIAINSISGYQKYISPHKGFACAYRLLYGGASCSQYVKNAIAREGLVLALKRSRRRFQACRDANQILKARYYRSVSNEENEEHDDLEKQQKKAKVPPSTNSTCLDPVDCSCAVLDLANVGYGLDCGALDCGHCAAGLDCSAIDCSVLDCGACLG